MLPSQETGKIKRGRQRPLNILSATCIDTESGKNVFCVRYIATPINTDFYATKEADQNGYQEVN